jgi:hypothetical protein
MSLKVFKILKKDGKAMQKKLTLSIKICKKFEKKKKKKFDFFNFF